MRSLDQYGANIWQVAVDGIRIGNVTQLTVAQTAIVDTGLTDICLADADIVTAVHQVRSVYR